MFRLAVNEIHTQELKTCFFSKLTLLMHFTLLWLVELVLNPAVDLAVLLQRSHPSDLFEVTADGRHGCSVALNYLFPLQKDGKSCLLSHKALQFLKGNTE